MAATLRSAKTRTFSVDLPGQCSRVCSQALDDFTSVAKRNGLMPDLAGLDLVQFMVAAQQQ
jgi:hypothetical protein